MNSEIIEQIKVYKYLEYKLSYVYTFKYHVFAPMGRFQLELIYDLPIFPRSFQIIC